MPLTIDLGDGRTLPMSPPDSLGPGFAAIITDCATWDDEQIKHAQAAFDNDDTPDDDYTNALDRIQTAIGEAPGADLAIWPCTFAEDGEPHWAGPYIDTLAEVCPEAAEVASAVLARDFALITEADFAAVTGWWVGAGLPLPPPRAGARFAADADEVWQNAADLRGSEYRVDGWPLAAVVW